MAMEDSVKVLHQYVVAPTPGTNAEEISLPLTYLDVFWVFLSSIERLIFYELPLSKSHFIDDFVPKLKDSLSSTLKDFLPLAGNLIIHSDSRIPEVQYNQGDGVTIIIAESCRDNFKHLTSNHPRESREFYPLVPQLSFSSIEPSSKNPVLALQVTLFPEAGICLGLTNHHAIGDASSIFRFMKAWAINSKLGKDAAAAALLQVDSYPIYDRSIIKDPKGLDLVFWDELRSRIVDMEQVKKILQLPDTNKIRQTFVLGPNEIKKLKKLVYNKRPTIKHLSSFTVTCAYLWTCLVKCRGGASDEEDIEIFGFLVDCRARVDPPIPVNYFGNCLSFSLIKAKHGVLVGDEGLPTAAEMIGETIQQKFRNKSEVFDDADTWITNVFSSDPRRGLSLAGSPRYNYYHLDFGWGKPIKFECTSIDQTGAISLSGCRDLEGGTEIGVSYPKPLIDAFASTFVGGLAAL